MPMVVTVSPFEEVPNRGTARQRSIEPIVPRPVDSSCFRLPTYLDEIECTLIVFTVATAVPAKAYLPPLNIVGRTTDKRTFQRDIQRNPKRERHVDPGGWMADRLVSETNRRSNLDFGFWLFRLCEGF